MLILTDPLTVDGLHEQIMQQVLYRNGALCWNVPDRTAQRAAGVINLKLPHKQMHYQQGSFFKDLKGKTMTNVTKNILRDTKLKISLTKQT